MKVIFLDHDGVICLAQQWGSRFKKAKKARRANIPITVHETNDNFDKKSIKILNKIIEQTGAEIVVSSDWKYHNTLEELGNYYEAQGIIKQPMDMTPEFRKIQNEPGIDALAVWRGGNNQLEMMRCHEIKYWLKRHPEVKQWVAIDDLNLGTEAVFYGGTVEQPWGLANFVWTPKSLEGIKQTGKFEEVIKLLS